MEHMPKPCDISGCQNEAEYWIDTDNGFVEQLLASTTNTGTFYLCGDHESEIAEDGIYTHLRIDTGEIFKVEIAVYQCHPECNVCL